ncbi:DUF3347 domain-containing protein [Pedobacter nyackensis]|uniref:DUF3347 domain-containing protein n=1 Tax=Pedobacter nyackensis TaxID=475255 RepID=UPI00292E5679|nr:DUF3347 domain-containing protein [Pedobacter nyackensis]
MKKILIAFALIAIAWVKPGFAQNTQTKSLLNSYYEIKNALVNSDAIAAALKASEFSKTLGNIDMKSMPKSDMMTFVEFQEKLVTDSKRISGAKSIVKQREYFANLSINLFKLAKVVKLTNEPVYYDYCPMKKSYWLTDNATIKNPYYGKEMLTCGTVKETLK